MFKKHITLCNKLIKHVFNLSIDGNNTKRKIHVNSVALPLRVSNTKSCGFSSRCRPYSDTFTVVTIDL